MRAALFLLIALTLGAFSAEARVIDRIVAVVNDEVVTLSELEDATAPFMRQIAQVADPVERERLRQRQQRRSLDDLVGQRLIMQEAARRKISVTGAQVDAHIKRVQAQQGWDEQKLDIYLQSQGLDRATFRQQVRQQLLRQRVVGAVLGAKVRLSDGDLREYYKEKLTRAKADYEIEAAHIVLAVPKEATPAEDAAIRQKLNEILARVKSGEDFGALAKQYSEGPGADDGGALGTVRRGSLDPTMEKVLFDLEPGQTGGPVRTRFGYHILKNVRRQALPVATFEESKGELRRELSDRRLQDELVKWVEALKEKAFIEIRL